MSIATVTLTALRCDRQLTGDCPIWSRRRQPVLFRSRELAVDWAEREGWMVRDGAVLCDQCKAVPA